MSSEKEPPLAESGAPSGVRGRLADRDVIANRAPRYALKVPVRFSSADGLAIGETVDISASGMLVMFERPVDVWLVGELHTYVHAHPLMLIVRVIRTDGRRTAVTFRVRTDADLQAVSELMTVAVEQGQFVAPIL